MSYLHLTIEERCCIRTFNNEGKSIRKRDKSAYKRKEFGHWEVDTVVSGIGKSKACFLTLVERKTILYMAVWMPNRCGETLKDTIITTLSTLPNNSVKTITCDRSSEFSKWRDIEIGLKCDVYFADPYCAWQKGSNETQMDYLENSIQKEEIYLE